MTGQNIDKKPKDEKEHADKKSGIINTKEKKTQEQPKKMEKKNPSAGSGSKEDQDEDF